MSNEIFVGRGERGLIVGQTGSGKSIMLQEQARQAETSPVVIYDTKGDDGFFDVPRDDETIELAEGLSKFKRLAALPKRKRPDYILVRPTMDELFEPLLLLDKYLQHQYDELSGSYAMLDEAYQFHKNGQAGVGLLGLLTRGRSRGISTVMCTQRPLWISRFCLTESQKFYIYFLMDIQDRKRIAEVTPINPNKTLARYNFWFYKNGQRQPTLFGPLPLRNPDPGYTVEGDDIQLDWL